ncbi:MAG: hypothetical protein SAMD01599839_23910 [Rectinema sp.]
MNIRTTTSVQGSKTYHYVQLVQSIRDQKTGKPKTIVLYNSKFRTALSMAMAEAQ